MTNIASNRAAGLLGRWRITDMDEWDRDAIDLVGPAFIEFGEDTMGQFSFIAVQGGMDCRASVRDGRPCIEFSWSGNDDADEATGRGWAELFPDGTLEGHIYFHQGMDSGFRAEPFVPGTEAQEQ